MTDAGLSPARFDALREVANVGAGHAATALSDLTRARIMISVSKVRFVVPGEDARKACFPDEDIVAVRMDISGNIRGRTVLILPRPGSLRLAERMLGREPGAPREIGTMEKSAIMEAGNIIGGAYLTALSDFLEMRLLPSPPALIESAKGSTLDELFPPALPVNPVLCVETQFGMSDPDEALRGFFLLIPDATSLEAIFTAIRVA